MPLARTILTESGATCTILRDAVACTSESTIGRFMSGQMTGQPAWSIPRDETVDFDAVFQAIAAPTRRGILDILSDGEHATAKDIGEQLNDVSRQALSHHLRVLRDAELIQMERDGQSWRYSLNADPLASIYRIWLGRYVPDDAAPAIVGEADDRARSTQQGDQPPLRVVNVPTEHESGDSEHEHVPLNVDDRLARLSERIQQGVTAPTAVTGRHPGTGERRSPTELNRALGRIAAEISARP